ncbi:MAG: GGDEF domain-containing protein [Minisyncoccia bacterium]|jgi:diguanylate cyclase (GGDEF)-like protein
MPKESLSPPSPHEEDRSREEREEGERLYAEKNRELENRGFENTEQGLLWLHSREAAHHEAAIERAAKAEELAITDGLTGLLNRHGFETATEKMLSPKPVPRIEQRKNPARRPRSFSVLAIDIDSFKKKINDQYGHPAGDAALKGIAGFLKENLREGDIASRPGGDEFILLFPDAAPRDIKKRFEGKAIEVEIPQNEGLKKKITVTLSGGLREFKLGENFAAACAAADDALYDAKEKGGNKIVIAGEAGE